MKLEFIVLQNEEGEKLGAFLRRHGVSLAVVRSLKFTLNGLCVNNVRARTNQILQKGDIVTLNMPQAIDFSAMPQQLPINIVYEDSHAMVLEKPAGQVVHPDLSHRENTLANAFCGLMQSRGIGGVFRPVGRLDGDTSGLVPCAMHAATAQMMTLTMQKEYIALVGGILPVGEGEIDEPIAPVPGSAIEQQVSNGGKASRTLYTVIASSGGISLVLVKPQTGRTHQIRVHFSYLGYPLLGDTLYRGNTDEISRHCLHCYKLDFNTFGGQVHIESSLPKDMVNVMDDNLKIAYERHFRA